MAYPTVSSPYGLLPINRMDGMPYAGQIRQIPIAANYATAIFYGDTVRIDGGYLVADASTTAELGNGMVGVLVGCAYTNSQGQPVEGQYYPAAASTASNLAYGYVVDDPAATFKVAVVDTSTTITTTGVTRAQAVGKNIGLVQNVGSTTTGNSKLAVYISDINTTSTTPMRVIDVVPETALGPDAFVELIVKINVHQYLNTTGAV
jgi:hypothetical protein